MATHYIKILKWLEDYAKQAGPLDEGWQRFVFDDLTKGGQSLSIVTLKPSAQGPLIGLVGETFFCRAGLDQERADCLFISRIEPLAAQALDQAPKRIKADLRLLVRSDPNAPRLDSAQMVIDLINKGGEDAGADEAPPKLCAALRAALSKAPSSLWDVWGPQLSYPERDDKQLLETSQRIWRRFKMERYIPSSRLRQKSLLRGSLRPAHFSERDQILLSEAFDLPVLNGFARGQDQDTLFALLEDLGHFTRDERLRAQIWAAMLAEAPSAQLRRFLHEVSERLSALSGLQARAWGEALIRVLARRGDEGDERLSALVLQAEDSEAPLSLIAGWASRLQFSERAAPPGAEVELVETPTFSRWVLALSGAADLGALTEEIQEALAARGELPGEAWRIKDVLALIAGLKQLSGQITDWLKALPTPEALTQEAQAAQGAFQRAEAALGAEGVEALLSCGVHIDPKVLCALMELVERFERLSALPTWLWGERPTTPLDAALRLLDEETHARVLRAIELTDLLSDGAEEVLAQLRAPDEGVDPMAHFEAAIHNTLQVFRALEHVPSIHRRWIQRALAQGATPNHLLAIVPRVEAIRGRINEAVFAQLAEYVAAAATPEEIQARVHACKDAISTLEGVLGTVIDASWPQIQRVMEHRAAQPPNKPAQRLTFEHASLDKEGGRVPLFFTPAREGDWGVVRVPLYVRTDEPEDLDIALQISVRTSLRARWSKARPQARPEQLSISRFDWRPNGTAQIYPFTLHIPLETPITGTEALEVTLTAKALGGERVLGQRVLSWRGVHRRESPIPFEWADRVVPAYVAAHPIGPQKHHAYLLNLVSEGGAFAVIAPRRFGKTTLVEFLYESAQAHDLGIARPIVCTSFVHDHQLDTHRLWGQVSSHLKEALGVGIQGRWAEGLPELSGFDEARRAAWELGKLAVLILFDEAHLFFPARDGFELANRLKDALERSWSRTDQRGMAPLVFGFVGLPSLRLRAGANLMGHLATFDRYNLEEQDLLRIIERATRKRLYTTYPARQRLSQSAGNLYLLKTLLLRLVQHLNEQARDWADEPDVAAVEGALRRALEREAEPTLSQYLRDVLNEADDINTWQPKACYPVAVCLAGQPAMGRRAQLRLLTEQLNTALSHLDQGQEAARVYTEARVEEHLASLEELGVWKKGAFTSSIFESWLLGIARRFPGDAADERALLHGALLRVRIPEGLEPVGDGRKPTLFRFQRDGQQYALRRISFATEAHRETFLEELEGLKRLQREQFDADEAPSMFQIQEVGVAEGEDVGVQIYTWIDGLSLMQKVGQVPPRLVVELGVMLADALRSLHFHGVLHRNIHPKTVILGDEGFRPFLIDFGVARLSHTMELRDGELCQAPELAQTGFTRAADVYALGCTLSSLLPADYDDAALTALLEGSKAAHPNERPTAEQLAAQLRHLALERQIIPRHEATWARLKAEAGDDLERGWLLGLLTTYRARLQAIALGLHRSAFDRSAEWARLLDDMVRVAPLGPEHLTAGAQGPGPLDHPAVHLLLALRKSWTHYKPSELKERIMARFQVGSDEALTAQMLEATRLISEALSLERLTALGRYLLTCPDAEP
ncbi:hypothetical protein KKF91_00325 [Myxococcota bacterium]|nr:hypothetical protein [Myxococcota bacterium]MBU1428980.1 hypothetical protein [Myxococcota bacterium]MBU1897644.1 hypothetical protein [Myxococcota bacterium]